MDKTDRDPFVRAARFFVLTGVAFAVSGSLTLGRAFPMEPIAALRVGASTREEVRAAFGKPCRAGVEDGDPTRTYLRYRFSIFGAEKIRDLYVRFDAAGKVKSYAFTASEAPAAPR